MLGLWLTFTLFVSHVYMRTGNDKVTVKYTFKLQGLLYPYCVFTRWLR